MKQVFVNGHGYLQVNDKISLKCDAKFYVPSNGLYTGTSTAALLDSGTYYDELIEEKHKGDIVNEHFLVTNMDTLTDLDRSHKYVERDGRTSWQQRPLIALLEIAPNEYVVRTRDLHQAIRLSTIIDALIREFSGESDSDFAIHWTACRSHIGGAHNNLIADMNSTEKDRVKAILR
ncbi:hypothetical protein GCM10025771_13010 [Niveibacterium umoris]|uniref:Uncharacterized protein n=1 Tax=Niveibacterium umoris TaxID=1193620 RepID=A0A840BKJ8_9RHOO|nr:hypothetical protein [Niveibacterium umoris]MBB4013143.1 hypothetical protein [Niveibacterium umoris]